MKMEKTNNGMTRRNFVKSATMMLAGAGVLTAGSSLSGCSSESGPSSDSMQWDYETDVVVVGFGNAGAMAALGAINAGSQVIVLEKAPESGGNSICAAGNCLGGWSEDDIDEVAEHLCAISYGMMNDKDYARDFVEKINALPEKLESMTGMKILWDVEPGAGLPLSDARYPFAPGHEAVERGGKWVTDSDSLDSAQLGEMTIYRAGEATFTYLEQCLNDMGADIRLSTPARRLIQDSSTGEIIGVVAAEGASGYYGEGGTEVNIKAKKGVILSCGGYENNREMFSEYIRHTSPSTKVCPWGTPYNTGDGVILAGAVGAKMWHTAGGEVYSFTCSTKASEEAGVAINLSSSNASIWVNRFGKRFMSEKFFSTHSHASFPFFSFTHTMSAPSGQDELSMQEYVNLPYWMIFDSKTYDAGPLSSDLAGYNKVRSVYEWSADNSEELEAGWIMKGDTIEELAAAIQGEDSFGREFTMDVDGLVATVEAYNDYCAKGQDDDYNRYPNTLSPIDTPPYYAIQISPVVCNTWGGAQRTANCEIVDMHGETIPRLYGAGEFGSIFSEGYVGALNFGEALATGLCAGEQAASLQSWDEE